MSKPRGKHCPQGFDIRVQPGIYWHLRLVHKLEMPNDLYANLARLHREEKHDEP